MGIARFSIPVDWKEEYESSGGATFYEDVPNSGTLRLNVLGFRRNSDVGSFESLGFKPFRDELYLKSESKNFTEEGVDCVLLNWSVGYDTEGDTYRIASFNHTIEAVHFRSEQTKREIKLIKWILKTAEFGRALGEAGDFEH